MSVYFAAAGGYGKIGYSTDPIGRTSTVTLNGERPADISRGADVRLIGWVPGGRREEAQWHRRFAADHVAGEWFYIDPDLVSGLIWDDPCGVDLERMSALAVFAANAHPGISREQISAAGIPVNATSLDQIDWSLMPEEAA
jgi:hypothetical protein